MKIERKWAMPNMWTFTIKPIKQLLEEEITDGKWCDPFAGKNSPASVTNDINIDRDTNYHMDALEFLKSNETNSFDGVLVSNESSVPLSDDPLPLGTSIPSQPNREEWENFMDNYQKPLYTIQAKEDILKFWESKITQALAEQRERDIEIVKNSVVIEKYWDQSDEYDQGMIDMKSAIITTITEEKS